MNYNFYKLRSASPTSNPNCGYWTTTTSTTSTTTSSSSSTTTCSHPLYRFHPPVLHGRGLYYTHVDLVALKKQPAYTATDCASNCIRQSKCTSFGFQSRVAGDSNPNVCIT